MFFIVIINLSVCVCVFITGSFAVSGLWPVETEEAGFPGHLQRGDGARRQEHRSTGTAHEGNTKSGKSDQKRVFLCMISLSSLQCVVKSVLQISEIDADAVR